MMTAMILMQIPGLTQMDNKKTFKDFASEDLNVFFNLNEFAEEHELDGNIIPLVVVDSKSDANFSRSGYSREQLYASQEVYKKYKTIYVKSSDYEKPLVDSEIYLDNEQLYVEEVSEDMGVIRILAYTHDG